MRCEIGMGGGITIAKDISIVRPVTNTDITGLSFPTAPTAAREWEAMLNELKRPRSSL